MRACIAVSAILTTVDDDGIVVCEVGHRKGHVMDIQHVPPALHERLGPEASVGLVSAVNAAGREWKDEVMVAAADRVDRRIVEETSKLRVAMAGMEIRLSARIDKAQTDLLKWSFAFWIGQVIAMTAIMSALLR